MCSGVTSCNVERVGDDRGHRGRRAAEREVPQADVARVRGRVDEADLGDPQAVASLLHRAVTGEDGIACTAVYLDREGYL